MPPRRAGCWCSRPDGRRRHADRTTDRTPVADEKQLVTPVPFRNERFSNDAVPLIPEPPTVGRGAVVAPEHRRVGAQPSGLPSLVAGVADDREEPAARDQPAGDLPEQTAVLLPGNVDEGVEGDYRGKACRREIDLGEVGPNEPCLRDEPTGPVDLGVGDIDSGHPKAPGQDPRCRNPRTASEVEDGRTRGDGPQDGVEPGPVLALQVTEHVRRGSPRAVPVGRAVPPGTHRLLPPRPGDHRSAGSSAGHAVATNGS